MKKSIITSAALAASLVSIPAYADDWTGFHIGAGVGAAHNSTDLSSGALANGLSDPYGTYTSGEVTYGEQDYFAGGANASANAGRTNFFGTVEGGYDHQVGNNLVIGASANYDFASAQDIDVNGGGHWEAGTHYGPLNEGGTAVDPATASTYLYDSGSAQISARARFGDSWALGARAGYLVSPRTLLYVTGGYTQAKIDFEATGTLVPSAQDNIGLSGGVTSATIHGSKWKDGYFLGGGIETLLGKRFSVKAEYRYSDYGNYSISASDTFSIQGVSGTVAGGLDAEKLHSQSVRLVLSYHI